MLLDVQDISVQFGGLRALNRFSFGVQEGEIVGMVGPNGAGKSTMVNAVSGALGRHRGRIAFAGRDITGLPPSRIAQMGLVRTFQLVQPFRGLTAVECVTLGALYGSETDRPLGIAGARTLAEQVLDFAGLTAVAGVACDMLNASQRRRLEIARALAARPKLILLDECLSGLNSSEIDQGITLVRAIRDRGIAILIIEHMVRVMATLADRIVVLDRGEKIADGPAEEVLTDRRAVGIYFGTTA
jgi:branched-chain amino acid transport system ATP-binding protein